MIDYDDIDHWMPSLSRAVKDVVPGSLQRTVASLAKPKFFEDAHDLVRPHVPYERLVDRTVEWLEGATIAAYHGTRLSDDEAKCLLNEGLQPLKAGNRKTRLSRALSLHPRWPEVVGRLDEALRLHGELEHAGRREGQVHLTLSKAGVLHGFNHYLRYGSEFDWHVAHALLGVEGRELLAKDGSAILVQVELEGEQALAGAHPFFSMADLRSQGTAPNVIREFLYAWCYRLFEPAFQARKLKVDCGIGFRETVPANRIRAMVPVTLDADAG